MKKQLLGGLFLMFMGCIGSPTAMPNDADMSADSSSDVGNSTSDAIQDRDVSDPDSEIDLPDFGMAIPIILSSVNTETLIENASNGGDVTSEAEPTEVFFGSKIFVGDGNRGLYNWSLSYQENGNALSINRTQSNGDLLAFSRQVEFDRNQVFVSRDTFSIPDGETTTGYMQDDTSFSLFYFQSNFAGQNVRNMLLSLHTNQFERSADDTVLWGVAQRIRSTRRLFTVKHIKRTLQPGNTVYELPFSGDNRLDNTTIIYSYSIPKNQNAIVTDGFLTCGLTNDNLITCERFESAAASSPVIDVAFQIVTWNHSVGTTHKRIVLNAGEPRKTIAPVDMNDDTFWFSGLQGIMGLSRCGLAGQDGIEGCSLGFGSNGTEHYLTREFTAPEAVMYVQSMRNLAE